VEILSPNMRLLLAVKERTDFGFTILDLRILKDILLILFIL
jgi:hypothetical protein